MKKCSVEGCRKAHLAKGYCAQHYGRMRLYGNPLHPDSRLRKEPLSECSIDGCSKQAINFRGWCLAHYERWKAYKDPLAGGTSHGAPAAWIQNVALTWAGDDCLEWPFATLVRGYGKLYSGGRLVLAHRYICDLTKGSPPTDKHEAAHSCGFTRCVNPHHIRWATRIENEADKIIHGTRKKRAA